MLPCVPKIGNATDQKEKSGSKSEKRTLGKLFSAIQSDNWLTAVSDVLTRNLQSPRIFRYGFSQQVHVFYICLLYNIPKKKRYSLNDCVSSSESVGKYHVNLLTRKIQPVESKFQSFGNPSSSPRQSSMPKRPRLWKALCGIPTHNPGSVRRTVPRKTLKQVSSGMDPAEVAFRWFGCIQKRSRRRL